MPASVYHGMATSLPPTVLFSTIALKCVATTSAGTLSLRSTKWLARMPGQITSIWNTSMSGDFAARSCW